MSSCPHTSGHVVYIIFISQNCIRFQGCKLISHPSVSPSFVCVCVCVRLQFAQQEEKRQKAERQHQQQKHESQMRDMIGQCEGNVRELQQLQVTLSVCA